MSDSEYVITEGDRFRLLLNRSIGAKIARARVNHKEKMSQSDLASKIGVTRASVSALESGVQGVSLEKLARIAVALGVPASALFPDPQELHMLLKQSSDSMVASPHDVVDEFLKEEGYGDQESTKSSEEASS